MEAALPLVAVAFGVGIVMGMTGMGGGALMTPALIFMGVPPTAAVANDLVAAAVNKSVGAAVHLRHGSPHLKLAGLLIASSVPTAFAGGFVVDYVGAEAADEMLPLAIGVALLLAASTYIVRMWLGVIRQQKTSAAHPPVRTVPTVLVGAVVGLLVGITSVGSGSLIMVALLLLYPTLHAVKIVGTDLLQATPLVLAAAVSHVIVTGVDWVVLLPLVVGGVPGTALGARIASIVSQRVIRRGIVLVLTLTGLTLLGVPGQVVGILGAAFLLLGPVAWSLLLRSPMARSRQSDSDGWGG